ncbi:protein CHUP1, chloroplastic [Lycium barbarum]|uniref:protein CHUP1, chloroplastic n=1 Tax=Lycium barbarum TaxID=112863 RepID=UPI00293EAA2D|nr:protein CHUP1, chloroplastic [Lycium barbarum]
MENNSPKVEMMKPVFLKAGIPLAITLAGYIIAKITTKKFSNSQISPIQEIPHEVSTRNESGHQNLENSESFSCIEADDDDDDICSTNTLHRDSSESFDQKCKFQENLHGVSRNESGHQNLENSESLSCIVAHVDDQSSTHTLYRNSSESFDLFQDKCKFQDIEAKFQQYTHLKEQEIALMDMQNKLLLEINKIDFLSKEITLMEAESQRFHNMVIEYLRIMELLDLSKSENSLLHRRVKKLLKKIKEYSRVVKEQNIQLEAKETEISRNQEGLEMKHHVIEEMELEIKELKMAIEQLQMEKVGLLSKLELAENSNESKNDGEVVTVEDYKELVNELGQLRQDKAAEDRELIYLRWCNACLRHELMRRNQEQMEQVKNHQENREIVEEFVPQAKELIMRRSLSVGHNESCSSSPINGGNSNDHSKRKKLMQKFKKWVEGSDKMKQEANCFKRHSVSDHTEDLNMLPARKSC